MVKFHGLAKVKNIEKLTEKTLYHWFFFFYEKTRKTLIWGTPGALRSKFSQYSSQFITILVTFCCHCDQHILQKHFREGGFISAHGFRRLICSYLRSVPEKNITVVRQKPAVEDSCSHHGGQEAERTIGKG